VNVPPPESDALPRLDDLDFELPADLVAQRPLARRDACRLLHVRRGSRPGFFAERRFDGLADLLRPGDVLVRNTSRVIPARLLATKVGTGARCELLLLEPEPAGGWWALVRPARRLRPGSVVQLADGTLVEIGAADSEARRRVYFPAHVEVLERARALGCMPLPPYIHRPADALDRDSYQTVYARVEGSVASPTAGLHFTPELLDAIANRGVTILDLVLHVGLGTFQPIRSADPLQHRMHWERFEIAPAVLSRLDAVRAAGGRIVAVGTTVARSLESVALWERGEGAEMVEVASTPDMLRGRTRLFIHPPYAFRRVDVLITNFHLPRTTLLLLVDAFAGTEVRRRAYSHAIEQRFRFFSYGDAMLID
jgi:S-adenosylmethionine:tRNA ribosyltransferase-isomerase